MKTIRVLFNTSLLASGIALCGIGAAHAADAQQKTFATPEAAAAALANAARDEDEKSLGEILGPSWKDTLSSGDKAIDDAALAEFVARFDRMHRWTAMTDGSEVLSVGADNYPYPIPLAKSGATWRFDSGAGMREVAVRHIGANELLALDAVDVIAGAEEAYRANAREGEVETYAQQIFSSDGKRDGLYWVVAANEEPSPLAELGEVIQDRAALKAPLVLDGYTFRILTAQGASATGGARSYVKDGYMSDGFAVLATPVDYGISGIASFMRGADGVVYEKDLGADTAKLAAAITAYEPGDGWKSVE
jgi:DUF2950 family protein